MLVAYEVETYRPRQGHLARERMNRRQGLQSDTQDRM
jgi:hypothetical protein